VNLLVAWAGGGLTCIGMGIGVVLVIWRENRHGRRCRCIDCWNRNVAEAQRLSNEEKRP
jgi:hypothetical protein